MPDISSSPDVTFDAEWLHHNAHLCQVSTRRINGEKIRAGRATQWDITIKRSLGFSKDHVHISLACEASAQSKTEKPLGSIEVEVVGNYRIGDEHPEIANEDAMRFGNEVGIRDVFPYLRQAVEFVSAQIGLGPVKLSPPEPYALSQGAISHEEHE
ncbi:hypothetical protein OG901_30275 [Streptomyces mirabilis]|uniref:hypothetical protein n=1 Tax=Streptomyces mirabilis TaxID=68239 RepID=UPI00225AEA99|nr:hypothetical protein [Streptomyces mirabilis]MCX5352003.1 hypothetical protein [Streptomyces mirabilis]